MAFFADVHSNLEALDACLAHARSRGVEQFVFLGDLVGYNADPEAVLSLAMDLVRREAAVAVQGNHDAAVAGAGHERMNAAAAQAIDWTRKRLPVPMIEFLAGLPLSIRQGQMLFVHASAASPGRWIYVTDTLRAAHSMEAAQATHIFCGHVHDPVLYYMGADHRPQPFIPVYGIPIPVGRHRHWLAMVGSCGQPRDGDPAARYVEMDTSRALMTFYRVPYDHLTAARKVREAGLPEEFARRLETGS
ncbi:metallophosphoesterase family protein [Denitratisoma sp. DHT3]|uniref:metallophosphoesterase family protein n=1 Tax=Denitratisoma sp. DHT3 TaxID=1981880 RepID=UPI0021BDDDDF|nr:metallophosphoesterase family protein [Denitratisoma sp. DHT3]